MSVIRVLGAIAAGVVGVLVLLLVLILDSQPTVNANASEQIADADSVNKLLGQIRQSIHDRHRGHVITVSEEQIESLIGFVQRAANNIHGTTIINANYGTIKTSVAVPVMFTSVYLNAEVKVLPADRLAIEHVCVGSLCVPGPFAVGLVESALNLYTDSEIGTQARKQISGVEMTVGQVAVTIRPMDSFLRRLNDVRAGFGEEESDELTEMTAYYLRYIAGREIALKSRPQPFNRYLNLIMARAREQSNQDNVLAHNKAAVLALAIFIGHHRIANFVGDVQPDVEHALKPAAPALLRGRNDLSRHFIISAALKMLSEQDVTVAIGEFKELMDRGEGGSGYSFVDLTADLAGVEMAKVLADPARALSAQDMLAGADDEGVYMPPIDGITEGLSKKEFTRRYDKVDSAAYLEEVERIRARLAKMPFYSQPAGD